MPAPLPALKASCCIQTVIATCTHNSGADRHWLASILYIVPTGICVRVCQYSAPCLETTVTTVEIAPFGGLSLPIYVWSG